jgi:hypothetical protein
MGESHAVELARVKERYEADLAILSAEREALQGGLATALARQETLERAERALSIWMRQQEAVEKRFDEAFPPMARHVKYLKGRGTTGRGCAFPGSADDGLDETERREMRGDVQGDRPRGGRRRIAFVERPIRGETG